MLAYQGREKKKRGARVVECRPAPEERHSEGLHDPGLCCALPTCMHFARSLVSPPLPPPSSWADDRPNRACAGAFRLPMRRLTSLRRGRAHGAFVGLCLEPSVSMFPAIDRDGEKEKANRVSFSSRPVGVDSVVPQLEAALDALENIGGCAALELSEPQLVSNCS
jgi:hypothetical protein